MTNLEALSSISPFSANSLLYEKVLNDNSVISSATYDSSNASTIELCSAYVAKALYYQPDISEGSLTVTYDKKLLLNYANSIFAKNRLFDEMLKINTISII